MTRHWARALNSGNLHNLTGYLRIRNDMKPFKIFCQVILLACAVSSTVLAQSEQENPEIDAPVLSPAVYWIDEMESRIIGQRVLDAINAVRVILGRAELDYSPQLNFAAFSHAADIGHQGKTWNFSIDGSSPVSRAENAGYAGTLIGENIAQAFDPPLILVYGWLRDNRASSNILNPAAKDIGLGWYQEDDGRTWWVLMTGG